MDILSSIPSTSLNMNNLTPYYNALPHTNMSRSSSSSSFSCVDPASPMLTPAAFVDQKPLWDSSFPFFIPPHVSVADYSFMDSTHSQKTLPKHAVPSRVSLPSARRVPSKASTRRGSTDSAYSSSSSLGVKCSSGSKKYRKDGAGEFLCPFEGCTYRYNLRRELNRHSNVHAFAGRDKYRCMNCNSGLCRLDSVKRHMEAKGKAECLKKGRYQEFRENGELVRERHCKPSWYEAAAANAAAAAAKKKGMDAVRCN
ncbi:hypothetical protein BGZ67_004002 [Mortierella alpina]|nr:hypothetical protein BGZ67_004002 [Mortierella alpina]